LAAGLGRAAKPKRLAAPAFAPTVDNGFRPLREALAGRAEPVLLREVALDLPAAAVAPLTLRSPRNGEDDLLALVSGLPLLFAPLPLLRLPFFTAELEWEPLRFPFVSAAALGLQRDGALARPPLVARELDGRESDALRLAGRLAEEACAGLRSRE
jgi:hypothetical protein